MISVKEAEKIILQHLYQPVIESVPIEMATGRILQEEMKADRPFPPFDRVSMDGIAIKYQAFLDGQTTFRIEAIAAAGVSQLNLVNSSHCIEVMTGAVAPHGTDTVIRYEDIHVENGHASIQVENVSKGQNIHGQGTDRIKGEAIVPKGVRITPAEIGVAASIGMTNVDVWTHPKIAVISTGDELIDINEVPLPHQIRKSNEYQIASSLLHYGIKVDRLYVEDSEPAVDRLISRSLREYDVMILSGGVSAGKYDFIPQALEKNGVERHFHKVTQRPGKPLWFGTYQDNKCVVFALPGNPVSSFMCTNRYILPWLHASLHIASSPKFAVLMEDYTFKPDLTYFLQVRTEVNNAGIVCAYPETGGGSGDLANLVRADSFLELAKGQDVFYTGDPFRLYPFRM